jgi:hypothetical protein
VVFTWDEFQEKQSYPVFCSPGSTRNPLVVPSQAELRSNWTFDCENVYISEVKGADGTQVAPRGLTGNRLDKQISDLNLANSSYNVYIDQVLRALPIFGEQEEGLVISDRVGPSSVKGIRVNRYETELNLLDASYRANYPNTSVATLKGVGVPRDGVAYFGYTTAFNTYFSKPNYLYGDYSFFLDAQTGLECVLDNSNPASLRPDLFPSCSGNSIEVWRCYDDSVVPPVRLEGPDCVRQDSDEMGAEGSSKAASTAERYDTYLNIEKASGKTLDAHKRLSVSFQSFIQPYAYLQSANPAAPKPVVAPASNILSRGMPLTVTEEQVMTAVIPQYWQDVTATITDDQVDDLNAVLTMKNVVGVLLVLFPILGFLMVLSFGFMLIQANRAEQVHPQPNTTLYTLHSTLYTLRSTLYTLHPTPYTLEPTHP